MGYYLIQVNYVILNTTRTFWVHEDQLVKDFESLNTFPYQTTFTHFLYRLEDHHILDVNKSWKNNMVLPGDTILYL